MITRQKIVSITLLPLLSLVALVAVACPADGEATSTDAMNEPAPVTTVGDPEPVQTPEIPVTTPDMDTNDGKAADPAPADTETEEEVMGMAGEGGEIMIELTMVMVSEDDTTPPPTSDEDTDSNEQDNSPEPSQTPDPDDSDEQGNSPTPEQEEQPPAQDEDVMDMSGDGDVIMIEFMLSEDDMTPPPTSDEDTDSDEPDVAPAPRRPPPPTRSTSPEPAEPMYETAPDFELPSVDDTNIRLSNYRGNPVVLVFYRSYFCSICRGQLTTLNRSYSEFQERDTKILAISSDKIDSLTSQLIKYSPDGLRFQLLYTSLDPTVPLAYERYGNVRDNDYVGDYAGSNELADPGVFLINAEGQIVWRHLGAYTGDTVSAQTILNQIDNLPGS